MKDISQKQANIILWIGIVLYVIFISFLSLKKYYNFEYNLFDLTIFNQVFSNSIEGRFFEMTFNLNNYLADHFAPIIFLLLPIYYIWASPEALLILQSLILALCAWPIYKISQKVLAKNWLAIFFALLWGINFVVHNANFYEWHILPLAIFFILWAIYFFYIKKFNYFCWFSFLTLLVREDMFVLLLGFSILAFLEKRTKKWIITPLLGLLYFALALLIISYFDGGSSNKFLVYYSWLGGDGIFSILWAWLSHPLQFLSHILSFHNIGNLIVIFLSLGLLPLLAPRYLWLLFFPLLQYILTSQGISAVFYNMHYGLVFLPAIFLSAILAAKKISENKKIFLGKFIYKNKKIFSGLFIFTILYFSFFMSPVKNILSHEYSDFSKNNKEYFVNQIPDEASLVVSASLAAPLSSRAEIYPLQYSYLGKGQFYRDDFYFPEVDYILLDLDDVFEILSIAKRDQNIIDQDISDIQAAFRQRLENYSLIAARDNMLLWQNKNSSPIKNLSLYREDDFLLEPSESDFLANFMTGEINKQKFLRLSFEKPDQLDKNYLIRFYQADAYFDLPLDYGLWPSEDWPKDKMVSFDYYLSDSVQAFRLYTWQGDVLLGDRKQSSMDMQLEPLGKRFDIR